MGETKQEEATLLVDLSHLHGNKIYLAAFKEDGAHEVKALRHHPVEWVMINRSGFAVCAVKREQVLAILSISAAGETSEILKVDRSRLPQRLEGDLSPGGRKISFKTRNHDRWCILSLNLVSGGLEEIFCNEGPISPPSWSPDGNAVAYYFGPEDAAVKDNFSIGVSRLDDGNWKHKVVSPPSKLCHRGPSRDNSPLWGPEGRYLIFEARYEESEKGPQAYVIKEDGSRLEHLTIFYRSPSVLTKSRSIAYKTEMGIMTRKLHKDEPQTTPMPASAFHVEFSPFEQLAAYCDGDGVIWVMNSSGGEAKEILKTGLPVPTSRFYWIQSSEGL